MSIKNDINFAKESLKSDEQTLTSVFKIEKFYKKHKAKIIALAVIIALVIAGIAGNGYYKSYQYDKTSTALNDYIATKSAQSLAYIKAHNKNLYDLLQYREIIQSNLNERAMSEKLSTLSSDDTFIKDMINYEIATLSQNETKLQNIKGNFSDLAILQAGYLLMQKGEIKRANSLLSTINNPAFYGFVASLRHYGILND